MVYYGAVKENGTWLKKGVIIIVPMMIILAIYSGHYIYGVFPLLLMPAAFYKKQYVISDKGVDIQITFIRWTSHDLWYWDEIKSISVDTQLEDYVTLHISKDVVVRSLPFAKSDIEKILNLALQKNSEIDIFRK